MTQQTVQQPRSAVCIRNADYEASLEVCKIYRVLADEDAARHELVRGVDESGEDYLYPAAYFAVLEPPEAVQKALSLAA